ncbi:uncharacterized protein LOC129599895 [Paramacrobiotus metropolitanus]|uniref:uncharacterized protein LOC129599895 n=1 Tax=Paramacrobiotus metropolitanus TaxID=2943436 RepID=UPI00244574CD|nr:uncharacterized protein LOC129599895 [Paramacrobiotus metropolitanus]
MFELATKMRNYPTVLFIIFEILLDIERVSAQSFPVFSQSSYSFTVGNCGAGTYVGQVSASGATSYSTDNSFVISINPSSGALSLGATIASTTTFNVIARNQYGSTQASVTVYANCGGSVGNTNIVAAAPAVSSATLVSPVVAVNNAYTYGFQPGAVAVDYNNPVVVATDNFFPYYNTGYGGWNANIYRNGNGRCIGNSCYYGGPGGNWGSAWAGGYGLRDVYVNGGYGGIYNYGGYGLTVQCFNGYCYNNAGR